MKILLAPMEGVLDHCMRETLTSLGGYDLCMTEFVRVTDRLLPDRVFRRLCPELDNGGHTKSGTPVVVQLLGGMPGVMAANACRAVEIGAPGIDINFGCPSRFVNRRAGGAILLKEPSRVHDVVRAVRSAVPADIPVSAKIRLGYEDTDLALENARAVQEAGADFITVHARTRIDGFLSPARWEWLARINEILSIPVVANGDIYSVDDYARCRGISSCSDVMIARGAISRPDLARQIRHHAEGVACVALGWEGVQPLLLAAISHMKKDFHGRAIAARLKQWLVCLQREYPEAHHCLEQIRRFSCYTEMEEVLQAPWAGNKGCGKDIQPGEKGAIGIVDRDTREVGQCTR